MTIVTEGYSSSGTFVVDLLRRHKADHWFSERRDIEFCKAIEWGDTNKMGRMLREGLDINKKGKNDMNFLIYSYLRQKKNSYKFLLENGADPNLFMNVCEKPSGWNLEFRYYKSALSFAADDDDPFYLEEALKHGGNPNLEIPDNDGDKMHILYIAIHGRNLTNVQLLVEAGADVNGGKKEGSITSPLSVALGNRAYDIAYYLLQKGVNPEIAKKDIIWEINSFLTATKKISKEEFMKMDDWERGFITLEQIEWRDKVIEILESKGYKFPDNVKKWGWTND